MKMVGNNKYDPQKNFPNESPENEIKLDLQGSNYKITRNLRACKVELSLILKTFDEFVTPNGGDDTRVSCSGASSGMLKSSSKKQLKDVLWKFLKENNRPFSFNEIHERCVKTEGKSAVQKALESLVSHEKVIEKLFGKQKIYFPKQENDENESEDDISILERQLASLQKSLKEKEDKIKDYEIEVKQRSSKPSLIELEVQQDDLKIKVLTLTEKLDTIKSSQGTTVNENDLKKINDKYEKYVSEFRKRKRICNSMIESILEGYPKTKKHLLDEVGVETDEMANFTLQI